MTLHPVPLNWQALEAIRAGNKTLEVRVGDDFAKLIKAGDEIKFFSVKSELRVRVQAVRNYRDFDDMLMTEPESSIAPGRKEGELVDLLRRIYPENRERLGVYVFEIELVK